MEKNIEETLTFYVDSEFSNKRLDIFLSYAYPEFSRSYFQKLIKEGYVYHGNHKVTKPSKKVKEGEEYTINIPKQEKLDVIPENIPIEIYYEDEDLAVVYKPAGMVVHPSPGHTTGTLVNALLYHFENVSQFGGRERAGIVHRLDKETAGLLVVAKSEYAHMHLQKQFQERVVDKRYKAIVSGIPSKKHALIELPIGRSIYNRKKMGVLTTNAREALTEYWVEFEDKFSNVSLLDIKIYTGRTHQIRVHLSEIGHPILNDRVYGFKRSSIKDKKLQDILNNESAHFLVAYSLGFFHPRTERFMEFELKELPEHFSRVIEHIKRRAGALK